MKGSLAACIAVIASLVVTFAGITSVHGQQVFEATPETLVSIVADAEPGSIIELVPGRYEPFRLVAKSGLHIRAQQEGTAVFSASSYDTSTGIEIADSHQITMSGVSVLQTKWGVSIVRSSEITIDHVAVHDIGQRGMWIRDQSTDIAVLRSSITQTGQRQGFHRRGYPYARHGEGLYVGNGADPNDKTSGVTIASNYIAGTPAEAIDIKTGTNRIDISSNVIHDVTASRGAIALHPGRLTSNIGGARVSGNVVSAIDGVGILLSAAAVADANVVFDTASHGIAVEDVTGPDQTVSLRNNTVFDSGGERYRIAVDQASTQPVLWGNEGSERLTGERTNWVEAGLPTEDLTQLVSELRALTEPAEQPVDATEFPEVAAAPVDQTPLPDGTVPIADTPVDEIGLDPTPGAENIQVANDAIAVTAVPPRQADNPTFPVYDTAWQLLVRATPSQANEYFQTLDEYDFTGSWAAIIHHAPATYLHQHGSGGPVGRLENGQIILDDSYVRHVRSILDAADRHGQKVGLIAAWQNTYLPGGNTGNDDLSNRVEGTLTTQNAYAYGQQIARAFGDHPAVSMWVFGGDAGTNNTEANKAVWREMARSLRDAGMTQPIGYHTPTVHFDQLNYAGETWLDFVAPETGHNQGPDQTEAQLRAAVNTFDVPVWQGEPRYFGINFSSWIKPEYQNPGRNEVVADAQAARNAGVRGYVYGDAGRWAWCLFQGGDGDASPCNPDNIAASFGQAERDVIAVFR